MSEPTSASEGTPETIAATEKAPGGVTLRGTPVATGLALGLVHRKDHDILRDQFEPGQLRYCDHKRFRAF